MLIKSFFIVAKNTHKIVFLYQIRYFDILFGSKTLYRIEKQSFIKNNSLNASSSKTRIKTFVFQ